MLNPDPETGDPSGKIRVAFVAFNFGEYCIRVASALAQIAEVLLVLPEEHAAPYFNLLDPAVNFQPFSHPRLRDVPRQISTVYRVHHQIRQFSPHVVHVQQGHFWFNLSLPWQRTPYVLTIHDRVAHPGDQSSRKTPQWVNEFGYRRANKIIVHTEFMRQSVIANYPIGAGHVHVIPHVKLGEETSRAEATGEPNVLFFGRIWEYKGLEYLIRAEPLITAAVPGAKIVIGGEGEDFSRYRKLMVNPENFVVHNRHLSDMERDQLFRQASVVALPYIEATQSGVIPLAYTFGKPVVATTVGGLPEAVVNGETGYCVSPRDEKALAEAIIRLLKDPLLRKELGTKANRKINAEWSAATIAQSTLEVYRQALAESAAKSGNHTSAWNRGNQ